MKPRKLTAGIRILSQLEVLWEYSQNPVKHSQWDLRFTSIENLNTGEGPAPQRFRYLTKLPFGLEVLGWGEAFPGKDHRSSALKFGSDSPLSLIQKGAGSWAYRVDADHVWLNTVYDYETRYGPIGAWADRLAFRPAMQWATRWSFDRLRLWLENGQSPALSLRLFVLKTFTRAMLALVWIYEGLIPKLCFVRDAELALVSRSPLLLGDPSTTLALLGIAEIAFGLWLASGWKEQCTAALSLMGTLILPAMVAILEPSALTDPFGGLSKNLGLIACAAVVLMLHPMTPSALRGNALPR